MTVNETVRDLWSKEKRRGDVKNLAERTGLSTRTILRVFENGECTPETYKLINDYFISRRARVARLEKKAVERLS